MMSSFVQHHTFHQISLGFSIQGTKAGDDNGTREVEKAVNLQLIKNAQLTSFEP